MTQLAVTPGFYARKRTGHGGGASHDAPVPAMC